MIRSAFLSSLFFSFAILSFGIEDQTIKKINNLNLLFPLIYENLESRAIEYTLIAYNGCYEWQSSRPEYLQVKVPQISIDACHTQAIVSLSSNKPYDNIIWITAKDRDSGDLLKVESKISKIHKIEILTKLRIIDVGDVQVLEVMGYDPEENVFSTLEGLKFNWKIEQSENILEFVPTKDSLIKSTEIRKKIENQNFQTDIILVKGLKTGSVRVHISINEKGYEPINNVVSLIVIERFMIWPENIIYILPKTSLSFELAVIKNENHLMFFEKIILPNKNYIWSNQDESLGSIQNSGIFSSNENEGVTEIIVKDIRITNNTAHSFIHIVEPWYMDLEVSEYENENIWENYGINLNYYKPKKIGNFENNWNLIKKKLYYVRAVIYDKFKNPLLINNDVKIKFQFNSTLFEIIEQRNHEILLNPLIKIEKSFFSAKLIEVSLKNQPNKKYIPTKMIECEKPISIYSQISIFKTRKFINLPYIRQSKIQQSFYAKALGGSGYYEFTSQNTSIFFIDNAGAIVPKNVGKTWLEVHDRKNWRNFDKIEVKINTVDNLLFPESIKETFTNSNNTLDIIAFSKSFESNELHTFSNCSSLVFKIKTNDQSPLFEFAPSNYHYDQLLKEVTKDLRNNFYKENLEKHHEYFGVFSDYINYIIDQDITDDELNNLFIYYKNFGVCNRLFLEIKNQTGEQLIKAYFDNDHSVMSEDIRLLAYNKYIVNNPLYRSSISQKSRNEVILSFGSSVVWSFNGGPNQLEDNRFLQENIFILNDLNSDKNLNISVEKYSGYSSNKNKKNYLIKCTKYSEQDEKYFISFNSWNKPDHQLIRPINASIAILVSCKLPKTFQIHLLKEDEPIYDYNSAKLQSLGNIFVKNQESYFFQVSAFDILNNPFYNISSLNITWSITKIENTYYETLNHLDISNDVCLNCLDEFSKARIGKYTGDILIQAHSKTYEKTFSSKKFYDVFDELILTAGYNIEADSQKYILYFHPENSIKINLFFGSGTYRIQKNDSTKADLIFNQSEHSISVIPRALGTIKIEIIDDLMIKSQIFNCLIFIVQCFKARLKLSPSIFQELDFTKVELFLYDFHENMIPISQMKFIDFTLDVLSFTDVSQKDFFKFSKSPNIFNQYLAQGMKFGSYRFVIYVDNYIKNDSNIPISSVSNEIEVYVYEKLTTIPNNLLLAPGCTCHVEIIGGPTEKAKITSNIELRIRVTEEKMIKLIKQEQNLYLVEGLGLGNGKLLFELFQKDSNLSLSVYEVSTRIEFVNNIEIHGFPERKVYLGASFRLLALMKFNSLLFTASICPFELYWTSNNKQMIDISIPNIENFLTNPKLSNYDKKILENYHIGINATAVGGGNAEIQLLAKFNYPTPFQKVERTLIEKIRILDYLTHSLIPYIRKTEAINNVFILPPKSEYQLLLNKDISKYKLRQGCDEKGDNILEVSKNGLIKTGEKKGKATLIIEEDDYHSWDGETVYINILVTNIYSLFVENSYKLMKMPIEATSELKIHYLDYYGRLFPANLKLIKLVIHLSNTKVVDIKTNEDNSLLSIRGKIIGATLCTIFLEGNPYVFDMFLIIVDSIITPSSPVRVHEDGYIQFNVLSKNGETKEKWFTNDNSIIELNQVTGKATALREGVAFVLYKETIQYTTKIHVFKINKVILDSSTPSYFTNIMSSRHYKEEYKILIRAFSDDYEIEEIFNEKGPINNNLKFICETLQSDWIFMTQEIHYDALEKKHKLFCVVKMKKNYPNDLKVPNEIAMVVHFISNRENGYKFSWKFYFEIYWAFKISDSSKINLNKKHNSALVSIMTPYELDVHSGNEFVFKALKTKFMPEKNEFVLNITIPPNYRMIEGSIFINNLITNQTELLIISYDPTSEIEIVKPQIISTNKYNFGSVDYLMMTLVLAVITLLWWYNKNSNENGRNQTTGNFSGQRFDFRKFDARNYEESLAKKINPFSTTDINKEIMGTPDMLKTPLDKRRKLQEGLPENLHISSNRGEDYSFQRHLIT